MNYNEFANRIKEKYPEYNDMDNKELARKMVQKYPDDYSDVTFDEPLQNIQINEDGSLKQPLQGNVKKFDLRPSALADEAAKRIVALPIAGYNAIKNKSFKGAYSQALDSLENAKHKVYDLNPELEKADKRTDALLDVGSMFMLPGVNVFKGAGLGARAGNAALTGGYQGGLIGGIESLRNEGDLKGAVPGAFFGAGLGGGLTAGGHTLGKALPWIGERAGVAFGGISPETLRQSIKPNSIALDLSPDAAQRLLTNTTERVRNAYNNLLSRRGEAVENTAKSLKDLNTRSYIGDIENDIKKVFDQYQGDKINPARNMTGRLEQDLKNLANSSTKPVEEWYPYINQGEKPSFYSAEKEAEAFDILSRATNRPVNWLRSQLKATNAGKGTIKRSEGIEKLLDNTDDNLDLYKMGNTNDYKYYYNANLGYNNSDDAQAGYNLARQAYDDIVNNNFVNESLDPMQRAIDSAEQDYRVLLRGVVEDSRNPQQYEDAFNKIEKITKNLPVELKEEYFGRLAADLDNIYSTQNTISAIDLQKIKEQIGKMVNWSDETARNYKNPILEQIYGRLNNRLSSLSPEMEAANRAYSDIAQFKKNEGLRSVLRNGDSIDSASTTLRNYNSTVSKGNTNRNIQDLENVLVQNGEKPFINTIDDINAAMDLANSRTTGRNFLGATDLMKSLLITPTLKGIRALNHNAQLPILYEQLGREFPSKLIPMLYGVTRPFDD